MLSEFHEKLVSEGDHLFSNRLDLESFWQEVAMNFYPELADFTITRSRGEDFSDHLTTSYPLLARRSLGDALSSLLRPVNMDSVSPGVWFGIGVSEEEVDNDGREWLERSTIIMRRAMYDRVTNFTRALKEGDHSFATFGQCPISIEINRRKNALLYQCHHLKDVVWTEGPDGDIVNVQRKWCPTASQLRMDFGKRVHGDLKELSKKDLHTKQNCRHIVLTTEEYKLRGGDEDYRQPYVSIWIDVDHETLLAEQGSWTRHYRIPRWVTIPGSQYASSPAVTVGLPDARLLQAMSLTLLEAGEKVADPPVVATMDAVRSDINLYAGGVTWIDAEYDEKLGDALRPLYHTQLGQGISMAQNMREDIQAQLAKAFFLDSLTLPEPTSAEMTAYEVGTRVSEWIRRAMPIFEPMEFEYNSGICEDTFELLFRHGGFGPMDEIPDSISGQEIHFKFESPLHESAERKKGQRLLEAQEALAQSAQFDPAAIGMLDAQTALRDVLGAIGTPAKWLRSQVEMDEIAQQQAEKEAMQQGIVEAGGAAAAAKDMAAAAKDFAAVPEAI